jgi:hypothetical protein
LGVVNGPESALKGVVSAEVFVEAMSRRGVAGTGVDGELMKRPCPIRAEETIAPATTPVEIPNPAIVVVAVVPKTVAGIAPRR